MLSSGAGLYLPGTDHHIHFVSNLFYSGARWPPAPHTVRHQSAKCTHCQCPQCQSARPTAHHGTVCRWAFTWSCIIVWACHNNSQTLCSLLITFNFPTIIKICSLISVWFSLTKSLSGTVVKTGAFRLPWNGAPGMYVCVWFQNFGTLLHEWPHVPYISTADSYNLID